LTLEPDKYYLIQGSELKGFLNDLVREQVKEYRMEEMTHCVDKKRAMEILGCSEKTFYNKVNSGQSYIRRSGHGRFIKSSIIKERDRGLTKDKR